MDSEKDVPVWVNPAQPEGWETQEIESADLRYRLPIRQGWSTTPQIIETPLQVEHIFQGGDTAQWLIVSFMEQADPKTDIRNWVDAFLKITGFPILQIQQTSDPAPQLLEWQYWGICPTLTQQLGVEETHLYQGLAQLPDQPPKLTRFYILLARRKNLAWKVSLSFLSACFPGMTEEMVAANDHVRAAATLGYISFL